MKDGWLWEIIENNADLILLIWLFAYIVVKRLAARHLKGFVCTSAFIYLLALFGVTLLGRTIRPEPRYELSFLWEYRLAFSFTRNGISIQSYEWLLQILNNILLFVPLGILYGEFCRWKAKPTRGFLALGIGLAVSIVIEISQLVFKLGLFEFDDMLNNSIGMMLGYGIYRMIEGRKKLL